MNMRDLVLYSRKSYCNTTSLHLGQNVGRSLCVSSIEGHVVTSKCQQRDFIWQKCADFRELTQAQTGLQLWPEARQPEDTYGM